MKVLTWPLHQKEMDENGFLYKVILFPLMYFVNDFNSNVLDVLQHGPKLQYLNDLLCAKRGFNPLHCVHSFLSNIHRRRLFYRVGTKN